MKASGRAPVDDPRAAVDLMLAAIEGVKLRALYEPHIACEEEQRTIVEGLMGMLVSPNTLQPAG